MDIVIPTIPLGVAAGLGVVFFFALVIGVMMGTDETPTFRP